MSFVSKPRPNALTLCVRSNVRRASPSGGGADAAPFHGRETGGFTGGRGSPPVLHRSPEPALPRPKPFTPPPGGRSPPPGAQPPPASRNLAAPPGHPPSAPAM